MKVTINGQSRTFDGPLTVGGMLESLGINPKSVVVERNLKIVSRSEMASEAIQEGDIFEIIRLVGGG